MEEVKRIRRMSCMKKEKDYPRFMEYTHAVSMTKNGANRDYDDILKDKQKLKNRIDNSIICPMNWMEESLDKIQSAPYSRNIPTEDFFVWEKGRANSRHLGKVRKIVEEYSDWVRQRAPLLIESNNEAMNEYFVRSTNVLEQLKGVKISKVTMNHLIASCLGIDKTIPKKKLYKKASKYTRKMLNLLYKTNKDMFLSCWKADSDENENVTS